MPSPLSIIAVCGCADDFRRSTTTFYDTNTENIWYSLDAPSFQCGDSVFGQYGYLYQYQTTVRHIIYTRALSVTDKGGIRVKTQTYSAGAANNQVVFLVLRYSTANDFSAVYVGKDGKVYYYLIVGGVVQVEGAVSGTVIATYNSPIQWQLRYDGSTVSVYVNDTYIGDVNTGSGWPRPGIAWNSCSGFVSDFYWWATSATESNHYIYFYLDDYTISPNLTVNSARIASGVGSRIQTGQADNTIISVSGSVLKGKTGDIGWNTSQGWTNPVRFLQIVAESGKPVYIKTPTLETAGIIKTYSTVKYTKGAGVNQGKFNLTLIEQRGGIRR